MNVLRRIRRRLPLRGRVRRFRRGNFAASRRGAARAGTGAPFSAREFLRRAQRGNAPAGRGVLLCLPHGLHPQGAACRFGKREVPARGGALNLLSSCAIGASSLEHSMSLQCEGTPSWERGKKKIRTKIDVPPLPNGFSLALPFPSTLTPLSIFLVAAWDKPRSCFSAGVRAGYSL